MTIFDYINSILFTKKKIELNCDEESQFSLFMLNRWCSFYSKELANYVNQTTNTYAGLYNLKQEQYDLIYNTAPKLKFKRIEYIKKVKKDKEEEDKIIVPEFISRKEYIQNVEFAKTLVK
jgi:hypothetical protein